MRPLDAASLSSVLTHDVSVGGDKNVGSRLMTSHGAGPSATQGAMEAAELESAVTQQTKTTV